jgi:chemotaxis protein MotB
MAIQEDPPSGVPEWIVTYGDMMSLLLTFFIMLAGMSELKKDDRFQAVVESLRRKFGNDLSQLLMVPGDHQPRNSALSKTATLGRSKRNDLMDGGARARAPSGEHTLVRLIRMGSRTPIGTMITFEEGSAELSEVNRADLEIIVLEMAGKPQKIEVRGHTSLRPVGPGQPFEDNWELAYRRARQAMQHLVALGIKPERIRISVAGPNEPVYTGTDPARIGQNPRVEVFLLDEVFSDPARRPEQGGVPDRGSS